MVELTPLFAILGVALAAALYWAFEMYCSADAPREETKPACPHAPDHRMVFTHDMTAMRCRNCEHTETVPRGVPQGWSERYEVGRALGIMPWQEGRSVTFLEALRGAS